MGSFGGMQDAEGQKRPPFDFVIKEAGGSTTIGADSLLILVFESMFGSKYSTHTFSYAGGGKAHDLRGP